MLRMLTMLRNVLALLFIVSMGSPAWAAPADDVSDTLARAEALYYEADFTKSIELLQRLDQSLRTQRDHAREKVSVKLQLALDYIGLNNNNQAKIHFRE